MVRDDWWGVSELCARKSVREGVASRRRRGVRLPSAPPVRFGSLASQSRVSDVLQADPTAGPQLPSCPLDATRESRIVLELIVEPILFRREPDQDSSWAPMSCHNDGSLAGPSEIAGQIVLHLRKRYPLQTFRPSRSSHRAASFFATIASTSTVGSGSSIIHARSKNSVSALRTSCCRPSGRIPRSFRNKSLSQARI